MTNCAALDRIETIVGVLGERRASAGSRHENQKSRSGPRELCDSRGTDAPPGRRQLRRTPSSRGAAGRPGLPEHGRSSSPAGSVPPPVGVHGLTAAHGDIVRVRIGLRDAYVLCHPELVRRVSPTHGPSTARDRSTKRSGPLSATASPRVLAPTTEGSAGCSSPPSTTSASEQCCPGDERRGGDAHGPVAQRTSRRRGRRDVPAGPPRSRYGHCSPPTSRTRRGRTARLPSTSSCAACIRGC